jgi:hypothetical protein
MINVDAMFKYYSTDVVRTTIGSDITYQAQDRDRMPENNNAVTVYDLVAHYNHAGIVLTNKNITNSLKFVKAQLIR